MNGEGVTIIIAAYRSEEVIARAIASARAQPEAAQIIVVVDASPDATAHVARSAAGADPRVEVIELTANQGPAGARNEALAIARGAWITILDDDDFMLEGRLNRLLALSDQFDFVGDDLLLAAEGEEYGARTPMWFSARQGEAQTLTLADFVSANCPDPSRPRRELGFLKPLMRRTFLERHRLTYDRSMRLGEDYDLYARALAAGARFLLSPAQGYVAVRRNASLSAAHSAHHLLALRASDDRLLANPALTRIERAALSAHRLSTDKRYQWQRLIDAVKGQDFLAAGACFFSDVRTSAYLARELWIQAKQRGARVLTSAAR